MVVQKPLHRLLRQHPLHLCSFCRYCTDRQFGWLILRNGCVECSSYANESSMKNSTISSGALAARWDDDKGFPTTTFYTIELSKEWSRRKGYLRLYEELIGLPESGGEFFVLVLNIDNERPACALANELLAQCFTPIPPSSRYCKP